MTALAESAACTAVERVFVGVATTRPASADPTAPPARLTLLASSPVPGDAGSSCPGVPDAPDVPDALDAPDVPDRTMPRTGLRAPGRARPRVRLVPAPPPARPRSAVLPPAGPPPTLAERVHVLRAADRPLDPDDLDELDEPRGAVPEADPSFVARRLAGASVEVIAGRRPVAQLARWLAPGVLEALRVRAAITRHTATPAPMRAPTVRGVRVCAVHEHLVEATAVVDDGRRVRAIALRLETHRGAWRATALEVG